MSKKKGLDKKLSKRKKVIMYSIGAILLILILSTLGGYLYINNMLNKVETISVNKDEIGIKPEIEESFKEIRNIALLGIDSRDESNIGRSDSIMILTLDGLHKKIKLTSIMRDSYVDIDGYGLDKINHAYAFGGAELALKTLNENFDLNISEVMAVNFSSLSQIIDKVGGVNINITEEEVSHIQGIETSGDYLLNGKQALAYSRIRYATGGDYKRTERQRTVVQAVLNTIKDKNISEYPSLINEFLPLVETNMTSNDMIKLGTNFATLRSSGLQQDRFPRDDQGVGETIDGVYYLTFNRDEMRNSVHNYIFEDK